MNCRTVEKLLPDFIENSLPPRAAASLSLHLAVCPTCRRLVKSFRLVVLEASDLLVPDPGEPFWNAFLPELRTRMEARPPRRRPAELVKGLIRRPAFLGSLVLAAVILFLIQHYSTLGPRGTKEFTARQLGSRLVFALRSSDRATLDVLAASLQADSAPPRWAAAAFAVPLEEGSRAAAGAEGGAPAGGQGEEGVPPERPEPATPAPSAEEELQESIHLYRAFKLQEALQLEEAQALALLPLVRELEQSRWDHFRREQELRAEIARLLADSKTADAALRRPVEALSRSRHELASREEAIHDRIATLLTPRQMALFLLFQESFRRELRQRVERVRAVDRSASGPLPEGEAGEEER